MKNITILTEPIDEGFGKKIYQELVYIKRKIVGKSIGRKSNKKVLFHSGPEAVLKNLINGFNKLNVKYNLNPKKIREVGKIVIVLSNIEALKQAVVLKKKKGIKYLLGGPNLVVLPSENKELICSRYINTYLVNSEWTREMYIKDAPELKNKIAIWAAGVDTNYWKTGKIKKEYVLVYIKSAAKEIIQNAINLLKENNLTGKTVRYGEYKQEEYLKFLQESKFAVFFSDSESQGIALFEAWSCNVPTLVWDRGYATINIRGLLKKKVMASSAPYLSSQTGLSFKNKTDFQEIFNKFIDMLKNKKFKPRDYILNNYSDKRSANKLLNIILDITK